MLCHVPIVLAGAGAHLLITLPVGQKGRMTGIETHQERRNDAARVALEGHLQAALDVEHTLGQHHSGERRCRPGLRETPVNV
jgi:hypothetical protein